MTSGKPDRAKYMSKIERKMANLMGQSFKTGIISTSPGVTPMAGRASTAFACLQKPIW
jgi:hypothetical protein